jgi:hypothetical protein
MRWAADEDLERGALPLMALSDAVEMEMDLDRGY